MMKEFYRPQEDIFKLIRSASTPSITREEFKTRLRSEGIDSTIPPSDDFVESFFLCMQAAVEENYKFDVATMKKIEYSAAFTKDTPPIELCANFEHINPSGITLCVITYDENDHVHMEEVNIGFNSKDNRSTKIVCLLKDSNGYSVINGVEYFSEDVESYFLKINEYFCSFELSHCLKKMFTAKQNTVSEKEFSLYLIRKIGGIKDLLDLKNFFGESVYLISALYKSSHHNLKKCKSAVLADIKTQCLSFIKNYYAVLVNQAYLKVKNEIDRKNNSLKGADEECHKKFYFPLDSVQDLQQQNAFLKKVLDYFNLFRGTELDKFKEKLTEKSLMTYADHNNASLYIWKKIPIKTTLELSLKVSPRNSQQEIHLLWENDRYVLLGEGENLGEEYNPDSVGVITDIASSTPALKYREEQIKISEIIKDSQFKEKLLQVSELRIEANDRILIDADLECKGKNVVLIAPEITVIANHIIDTSGENAISLSESSAKSGFSKRQDPKIPCGLPGDSGECGEPGGSAGHVYINAGSIHHSERLTLKLNGGMGGNGFDGQDGDEGKAGKDGKSGEVNEVPRIWHLTLRQLIVPGTKGTKGQDGGHGGRAGMGGQGGAPGKAIILCDAYREEKIGEPGINGENGKCGKGGAGGRDGHDGCDHGLAWQSNFWSLKIEDKVGLNLIAVPVRSTRDKPPIKFVSEIKDRDQQSKSSSHGKNGDQLARQLLSTPPRTVPLPLGFGQHLQENEEDSQIDALKKDLREVNVLADKMLNTMKSSRHEIQHKVVAEWHKNPPIKKVKAIEEIALKISLGDNKFEEIENKKNKIFLRFVACQDSDVLNKVEYILEYLSTYAGEYFEPCIELLEKIYEIYNKHHMELPKILHMLDNVVPDVKWLRQLSKEQCKKLEEIKKISAVVNKTERLIIKLYNFKARKIGIKRLNELLDDASVDFFHPMVKEKIVEKLVGRMIKKLNHKVLSYDERVEVEKRVLVFLEESTSGFAKSYKELTYKINEEKKINELLDDILHYSENTHVESESNVNNIVPKKLKSKIRYLIELHHKASQQRHEKSEIHLAIAKCITSVCEDHFKYFQEENTHLLRRLLSSPKIEKIWKKLYVKKNIKEKNLKKNALHYCNDLLTTEELFLKEFLESHFPHKKAMLLKIMESNPVKYWRFHFERLVEELIIDKMMLNHIPGDRLLGENLRKSFFIAKKQKQIIIWLKSVGYLLTKHYVKVSAAFIELMCELDNKDKLFEILTHKRPQHWVRGLLLQNLSEYLDVFIKDKSFVFYIMDRIDPKKHNEILIRLLNSKLREEIALMGEQSILSADKLKEIVQIFLNHEIDAVLFEQLNQCSLFHWEVTLKKKLSNKTKAKKENEPRNVTALVAALREKNKSEKILNLCDSMEEKIIRIKREVHTKYKDFTLNEIKCWCEKAEHREADWIKNNMYEVIAVISQAAKITQNNYPYDTQYLALILLLEGGNEGKGLLARVATSEGKTLTTAMFAIYNALIGNSVDIDAGSSELAERNAEKNKSLFNAMNITVSNNCSKACENDLKERERAYEADVVYGDIGSFERDYLLTELLDEDITGNRNNDPNHILVVDEVDSLLLDQSEHVLYLSHEMPDFRHLRVIYVEIWNLLQLTQSIQSDAQRKAIITKDIQAKLDSGTLQFPQCLKKFVNRRLSIWIEHAFIADRMTVNDPYMLASDKNKGEKDKIVVIDKDTGIEHYNMTWENGLHQFLELKHQKKISVESLKSVFISNFSYLKLFDGRIYGLSGTLGSASEQALISSIYQVDLCNVPRLRPRNFTFEEAILVEEDELWIEEIKNEVETKSKKGQALLVLCKNREDVKRLKHILKVLYPNKVHSYSKTTKKLAYLDYENPVPMQPGDILIATNLAGRGTDILIDSTVEKNGGLHEILTYMPSNKRIEKQNFARVARRGQPGSGRFIIKSSMGSLESLRELRDFQEEQRLEFFRQSGLQSQLLKNELFNHFKNFCTYVKKMLYQEAPENGKKEYIEIQLKSLQNEWALWLDENDERIKNARDLHAEVRSDYYEFELRMNDVLTEKADPFKFAKFPHDLLKLGFMYLQIKNHPLAVKCFEKIIENEPHYSEIAHIYDSYVLSLENKREVIVNKKNDPKVRKEIYSHLKKAKKLLEKRIYDLRTLVAVRSTAADKQSFDGKGLSSNGIQEQLLNESKLLTVHVNAITHVIGRRIDKEMFLSMTEIVNTGDATKLFDRLMSCNSLIKPAHLSKNARVTENAILVQVEGVEHKIKLPEAFASSHDKILQSLRDQASQNIRSDLKEFWPFLHNAGVVKDPKVKISLDESDTEKKIEKKLNDIKSALKKEIELFFAEKNKAEKAESEVAKVKQDDNTKTEDKLAETDPLERKYADTIFKVIQFAMGELKTIPKFKIELSGIEKYLSTGEVPPEIVDFQRMIFDKVISINYDKSLWSWEAFAVAMFGVSQIMAGSVLTVMTYGVGTVVGGVLVSEGIGDILYAVQAGLRGTFNWKEYFIRKGLSVAANVCFAGVGGLLTGVFTGCSGVIAMPAAEIAKKVCFEVVTKLGLTVVASLGSMAFEQLALMLPSEIAKKFGEKIQTHIFGNLMPESVQGDIKASLVMLYKKIGIEKTHKKVEALLKQIQNDEGTNTTVTPTLMQWSSEFVVQAIKVFEQKNIGSGLIDWAIVGAIARICVESVIDLVRIRKLAIFMSEKFQSLPVKLRELSETLSFLAFESVTAADMQAAADGFIKSQRANISHEMVSRIVNDILTPRLQAHMTRSCRMISMKVSASYQGKSGYTSSKGEGVEISHPVFSELPEAPDLDVNITDIIPAVESATQEWHHHSSNHGETSLKYSSRVMLFKGHHHRDHHHGFHEKHHTATATDIVVSMAELSTNLTVGVLHLIEAEQNEITRYRLACAELAILKTQLDAKKCIDEYDKKITRLQAESEKRIRLQQHRIELRKQIAERKIEIERLELSIKLNFTAELCSLKSSQQDRKCWIEARLNNLNKISVDISSGSAGLNRLFREICKELSEEFPTILRSADEFISTLVPAELQDQKMLEQEKKYLIQILEKKENKVSMVM